MVRREKYSEIILRKPPLDGEDLQYKMYSHMIISQHRTKEEEVHNIQQGTEEESCTRVFGWTCRPRSSTEMLKECSTANRPAERVLRANVSKSRRNPTFPSPQVTKRTRGNVCLHFTSGITGRLRCCDSKTTLTAVCCGRFFSDSLLVDDIEHVESRKYRGLLAPDETRPPQCGTLRNFTRPA